MNDLLAHSREELYRAKNSREYERIMGMLINDCIMHLLDDTCQADIVELLAHINEQVASRENDCARKIHWNKESSKTGMQVHLVGPCKVSIDFK